MFRIHTHLNMGVCSCSQDLSKSVYFEQTDVSQMENEMHSLGKKGNLAKEWLSAVFRDCYVIFMNSENSYITYGWSGTVRIT